MNFQLNNMRKKDNKNNNKENKFKLSSNNLKNLYNNIKIKYQFSNKNRNNSLRNLLFLKIIKNLKY